MAACCIGCGSRAAPRPRAMYSFFRAVNFLGIVRMNNVDVLWFAPAEF